jgi:hypothetical protein
MNKYLTLIDAFLSHSLTFEEFSRRIETMYAADSEFATYTEKFTKFAQEVYDRSTYASEGLPKDDHDRGYGLTDSHEYEKWLNSAKQQNIEFWPKP